MSCEFGDKVTLSDIGLALDALHHEGVTLRREQKRIQQRLDQISVTEKVLLMIGKQLKEEEGC